jgi:TolB-like protein
MSASEFNVLRREAVQEQLTRIQASPAFSRAPFLCRFIRVCVEETIRGNGSQLKELWLSRAVFGRDASFNPAKDAIVRVQASRLRGKLAAYYLGEGAMDKVRITFPVGSYVPVLSTISRPRPATGPCSRWTSIAVLPLLPMETGSGAMDFAEMVTGSLTHALVEAGNVGVVSRTSARAFRGAELDVREIGRALDARYVVEGSVSRGTETHRISLQLTDAETGYHCWSAWFEQRNTRAFPDVSRIARMLAAELSIDSQRSAVGAEPLPLKVQSTSANPRFM